ncbi:MAG: DUF6979 family protein [Cetobacterium sp.]
MNKYAKIAIEVAEELQGMEKEKQKEINLGNLWKEKCKENEFKEASIKKGCPRLAFVGLCENNLIKDIEVKNSDKESLNKNYAVEAVKVLKNNNNRHYTSKELWEEIGNKDKKHNSQMNIVLALWEKGMIE